MRMKTRMKIRNPKSAGRKRFEFRIPKATRAAPGLKARTVTATAREVIAWLHRRRDPDRARGVQQYFKHEIAALGIDTPTLRAFAASQSKRLTAAWALQKATSLCDRLLREPELEVRGIGILILGAFKPEFRPGLTRVARRWLATRLDNWALVDSFCGTVLSPLLEQHPGVEQTLRTWSRARALWVRRAAIVTLVPFARRGRLLDAVYQLAQGHLADPEDLMHKAVGWLLREAGKTDMPRLRQFLLRHGPTIPRTTLRYAIERFPPAERGQLLESTRPPALSGRAARRGTQPNPR
jgi:3-methyladenine DNA glycosylase AlkD